MTLESEKKLCEEATPGEWPYYYDKDVLSQIGIDGIARPAIPPSDAKFIAHFNPDKVMKMLRVIEAVKECEKAFMSIDDGFFKGLVPAKFAPVSKAYREAGYD